MDVSIFQFLNGFAGRSPFLDGVIVFFGERYIYFVVAFVVSLAIFAFARQQPRLIETATLSLLSGALSFVLATTIKLLTHRSRPFLVMHVKQLLSDSSFAFPSGHTTFLCAMAVAAFPEERALGAIMFASAILVGSGRIAAGIHWPSDVIGGLLVGTAMCVATRMVWRHFRRQYANVSPVAFK